MGYAFILTAAALWALIGPVSRFVLQNGVAPLEVAFWRAAFGCLFFSLHAAGTRSYAIQRPADGLVFFLFGATAIGGFFASYLYAVQTGGAALAAVLLYTAPVWVAVFSRLLFHEPVTGLKAIAILFCLAGVACISFSSGTGDLRAGLAGIGFGALAGMLYSMHYIFSKKYLARYSAITLYAFWLLGGTLALLPFVDFTDKSLADWARLLCLGLFCTYGAYWAYGEGVKRLELTRAVVLATLEPVLATLAAWWWWGELFTPVGWLGAGLIMGAVLLMIYRTDAEQSA